MLFCGDATDDNSNKQNMTKSDKKGQGNRGTVFHLDRERRFLELSYRFCRPEMSQTKKIKKYFKSVFF